jgi:hypothetical protein
MENDEARPNIHSIATIVIPKWMTMIVGSLENRSNLLHHNILSWDKIATNNTDTEIKSNTSVEI